MKKSERIMHFVSQLAPATGLALDPFYEGFFTCFNEQKYYEAHDVLEHLWLKTKDENHRYFKGLIQIAGAFVHLQKQFARPTHPKDGRRLAPASRLFDLGMMNVETYRPSHMRVDIDALLDLCEWYRDAIVRSDFTHNPWHPDVPPHITLTAPETVP